MKVDYDDLTDCIRIDRDEADVCSLRPSSVDGHLMLRMNKQKEVVGIIVAMASERRFSRWLTHRERQNIPSDILDEADRFLGRLLAVGKSSPTIS